MSFKKYLYHAESNLTFLQNESTLETPKALKYLEYWKRARRAIRLNQMLHRFNNYARNNPYTVNQEVLEGYLNLNQVKTEVITKTLVFTPYSSIYLIWTFLIIVSLVFISIFGVFHTAFMSDSVLPEVLRVEAFIDVIFLFDIFITLNLATYDSKNNLIFDRKTITLNYLKGRFIIDFLAGLPTGFFISEKSSSFLTLRHFFKMLKWIGLKKRLVNFTILKLIDSFLISNGIFFESLSLSLMIFCIIHIFACLWYLSARYEEFSNETWVFKSGIQDFSLSQKYLTSLYFIITTLSTIGYGEIKPFTDIEVILTLIWSFLGLFLVSSSVGHFTVILNRIFKNDLIISQRISMFEDFSKSIYLPRTSIKSIKKFIRDKNIVIHRFNISKVLESLDMNLKYEIAMNVYNKGIQKIVFFHDKSVEFLSQVTFLLEFYQCQETQCVWRKNCFTDGIYFMISGKVKFLHNGMLFYFYYDGGFFGDLECFFKCERKFDAVVCETCQCFKMNLKTFKVIKDCFPKYYNEMKDMAETRKNNLFSSLAQMVAVNMYSKGEILNISKSFIETVKQEFFFDLFSLNYSANKANIIENTFYDLKNINYHKSRIKSLLKSAEILQTTEKPVESFDGRFSNNGKFLF